MLNYFYLNTLGEKKFHNLQRNFFFLFKSRSIFFSILSIQFLLLFKSKFSIYKIYLLSYSTRCLMLKTLSEQLWQKLNEMESHCEIRKFCFSYCDLSCGCFVRFCIRNRKLLRLWTFWLNGQRQVRVPTSRHHHKSRFQHQNPKKTKNDVLLIDFFKFVDSLAFYST